ncbi:MAG: PAS domain S-box protein, partial [Bacilli bacterium]|nr:PAS domain S-box protein [Bacilli bacterium]
MMMKDILLHISLLIAYLFIIGQLSKVFHQKNYTRIFKDLRHRLMAGLFLGVLGFALMVFNVIATNELSLDLRHVAILLAALYFGWPAVVVTTTIIAGASMIFAENMSTSLTIGLLLLVVATASILISRLAIREVVKVMILNVAATGLMCTGLALQHIQDANNFSLLNALILTSVFSMIGGLLASYVMYYTFGVNALYDKLDTTQLRLAAIISNMNSGIIVQNLDQKIELTNPKFYEIFNCDPSVHLEGGYAQDVLVDKYANLVEAPDVFIQRLLDMMEEKQLVLNEEVQSVDGHTIEFDFIPILTKKGHLTDYLWDFRDITERKQNQIKYKQLLIQYRTVVDNAKEVIFQTDLDGNWTFLNSAWTVVTGFPVNTSIGQPFWAFVYEEDREIAKKVFNEMRDDRQI